MTIEHRVLIVLNDGLEDLEPIANRCNLSVRQVRGAIDRLRKKGHGIRNQRLYRFHLKDAE